MDDNDGINLGEVFNEANINAMTNIFANFMPGVKLKDDAAGPIKEAIKNGDRELALRIIDEGLDPFARPHGFFELDETTAFHHASATGDIELLLAMAAEPGTQWTRRFVVCRNKVIDVPVNGRPDIPQATSNSGNFFHTNRMTSMEGLEVMLMYGYKLKSRDFEYSICHLVLQDPEKFLRLLKLGLASGQVAKGELKLELSLGMAIGGPHGSFVNGRHPSSLELARILLKAGANPNGYCFQGETPYDYTPAVFQALQNRDEDMTRLLISYGADVTENAQFSSWTGENELDIENVSISEKAEEVGMVELLVPQENVMTADPDTYIRELRKEFETPLRRHVVPEYSNVLIVAMMRATGHAPPVGMMYNLVLQYCPLGFNLWKINSSGG